MNHRTFKEASLFYFLYSGDAKLQALRTASCTKHFKSPMKRRMETLIETNGVNVFLVPRRIRYTVHRIPKVFHQQSETKAINILENDFIL